MIIVEKLSKSYARTRVLNDLTFEVKPGHITGLLGPNACGKTTLIKCLLGLVVPDGGVISVFGSPISGTYGYREKIGYMPQTPDFPVNLTPNELFKLLTSLRRHKPTRRDELIDRFGIARFLSKSFGTLSAGTRQKVSAVAAMMFEPELLILDEPTASLDPVASVQFRDLLIETAGRNVSVLVVSHVILELERLVQDILFLLNGTLLFGGTAEELRVQTNAPNLEQGILRLLQGHGENVARSLNDAHGLQLAAQSIPGAR